MKAARKSFLANIGADVSIALSLGVTGMALYSYYLTQLPGTPDQAFPHFIAHAMPRGLAGLVVAALFSAAMSSLDSGMHGVATVITVDFFRRLRKQTMDAVAELRLARLITVAAGLFAIGFCLYLNTISEETRGNLYEMTVRISSYITGTLGGMFFAAFLRLRCSGNMMIASGVLGVLVGFYLGLGHWFLEHPRIFLFVEGAAQTEQLRWEPSLDEPNLIGSDPQANRFALPGPNVAAQHATIELTEDGWQVRSADNASEIQVNERVTTQARLRLDDVIGIGENRILVKVKAISWMWVLPIACVVTLLSAAIFSLFSRRRPLAEAV